MTATAPMTQTARDQFLQTFNREHETTMRVLRAYPKGKETLQPHPKLKGTIYTAADEVRAAGGKALPIPCDIREEAQVMAAIDKTVAEFGGFDICINNASAISLTGLETTTMKMYDRMYDVNARGSYMVTKSAMPHLLKADNPHVLNLSLRRKLLIRQHHQLRERRLEKPTEGQT